MQKNGENIVLLEFKVKEDCTLTPNQSVGYILELLKPEYKNNIVKSRFYVGITYLKRGVIGLRRIGYEKE